jgi:hypothetical protein
VAGLDCNRLDNNRTFIPQTVINNANQIAAKALSLVIPGPEMLSQDYLTFLQAIVTLLSMIITIAALSAVLEMIPSLARSIIGNSSLALIQGMKLPAEGMLNQAFTGARKGMGSAASNNGLFTGGGIGGAVNNVRNLPGVTARGVQGVVNQMTKMLTGGR